MNKKYKLGVVGRPIEHSLSPFIHSRFSRNENINIEYLPYKVNEPDFESFVKEFFSHKDSKGLNITLPYKKNAANIKGNISSEAKYINAVNTLVKSNGELSLYSTDGKGFINDIDSKGFNLINKKVLIIGAGAAVESVLYRVAKSNTKSITLFNRTEEKANRLIRKFSNMAKINLFPEEQNNAFDVVINGSSAGLTGEFEPIEGILTDSSTYFYDLNYSLTETPFCKWASENSRHVFDGIGMLVYQAAYSFEKWFDIFPETESVISDLEGIRE
tara:strand:+ start:1983 stop:2801 length:819 start_codon:yes stop_codon:yes gene_type:complete